MAHSTASGRLRIRYYTCAGYHNKGKAICTNGLPLSMVNADDAILSKLRDYVLQPDIIDGAIHDAIEALKPKRDAIEARRQHLEGQIRIVEQETSRLAAAIAAGGPLDSLVATLRDREKQRDSLRQQIVQLDGLTR